MVPELELDYSSQGGNGIAGVGWVVGGLPSVRRCAKTLAVDGVNRAANITTGDALCLDSERLLLVSAPSTEGLSGAEYRTAHETFSRITAVGPAGQPPTSFRVEAKSGRILEFAFQFRPSGMPATFSWHLSRVSDRSGNYFTVEYDTAESGSPSVVDIRPTWVRYTGNTNAGLAPYASVQFVYSSSRPDELYHAERGSMLRMSHLLTEIRSYYATDMLARRYVLTYGAESAGTGRSLLRSVQECGASGECLAPTVVGWQEQTTPLAWSAATTPDTSLGVVPYAKNHWFLADVMGTGVAQLIGIVKVDTSAKINVYTRGADGSYTLSAGAYAPHPWDDTQQWFSADVNADGRIDIVLVEHPTAQSAFTVTSYISTYYGTTFTFNSVFAGFFSTGGDWASTPQGLRCAQYIKPVAVVDANSDGRADLLFDEKIRQGSLGTCDNGTRIAHVVRPHYASATGSFSNTVAWTPGVAGVDYLDMGSGTNELGAPADKGLLLEETGGAKPDMVYPFVFPLGDSNTDALHLRLWEDPLTDITYEFAYPDRFRFLMFPDVNGDGKVDFVKISPTVPPASGHIKIIPALTQGDGSYAEMQNIDALPNSNFSDSDVWLQGNVDDESGDDLIVVHKESGNPRLTALRAGQGVQGYELTDANSVISSIAWSTDASAVWLAADTNGDGRTDVVYIHPNSGKTGMLVDEVSLVGGVPEVVDQITNGMGAVCDFDYAPLTDPNVYTEGTVDLPGSANLIGTALVTSQYSENDGIGGWQRTRFTYSGLRVNVTGVGMLGFEQKTETKLKPDLTPLLQRRTTFSQEYPLVGVPLNIQTIDPASGIVLSEIVNSWNPGVVALGTPTRAHLEHTTETTRELDGTLIKTVTVDQTFNAYDDANQIVTTTVDNAGRTFRRTLSTDFDPADTSAWLIGIPSGFTLTSEAPGVPTLTRTEALTHYPGTTLVKDETLEPNEPVGSPLRLTRSYGRDSQFGVVTSTTLSGLNSQGVVEDRTSAYTYDAEKRFARVFANPLFVAMTRDYSPAFGVVVDEYGPNGQRTHREIDTLGRVTLERTPDGVEMGWSYTRGSHSCSPYVTSFITKSAVWVGAEISALDSLGREICSLHRSHDNRWVTRRTNYDTLGQVESEGRPFFPGDPEYLRHYEYDLLGRVKRMTETDAGLTTFEYASLTSGFDVKINQVGHVSHEVVDGRGLTISATDDLGNSNSYTYDAFGNRTSATDPTGQATTSLFDLRGRRTQVSDLDRGTQLLTYDAFNELRSLQNARGQLTSYVYDALGRLTTKAAPEGTSTWTYDPSNALGQLASVTGSSSVSVQYTRAYTYDLTSRPVRETITLGTTWMGTQTFQTAWSYDSVGRVGFIQYPSGLQVMTQYDFNGFMTGVYEFKGYGVPVGKIWEASSFSADDQVLSESYGNGVLSTRDYDPVTGNLVRIATSKDSATVHYDEYSWDFFGNLKTRYRILNPAGSSNISWDSYTYDTLNRLQSDDSWTMAGGSFNSGTQTVGYDGAGNITSKSDVGAYVYGEGGHGKHTLTSVAGNATTVDLDGNVTNVQLPNGFRRIAYFTSFNKPFRANRTAGAPTRINTMTYGPGDELLTRVEAGTSFPTAYSAYVTPNFDVRLQNSVFELTTYVGVGDRIVALRKETRPTLDAASTTSFFRYVHSDHLNSTTVLTDSFGNAVDWSKYDSWGSPQALAGAGAEMENISPGYTAQRNLTSVNLVHMGGRAYDPVLGRFLSPDPVVQDPASTQGWNPFSYVRNNPLSYTDPTGYESLGRKWDRIKRHWKEHLTRFRKSWNKFWHRSIATHHFAQIFTFVMTLLSGPYGAILAPIYASIGTAIQIALNGGNWGDVIIGAVVGYMVTWAVGVAGQAIGAIFSSTFSSSIASAAAEEGGVVLEDSVTKTMNEISGIIQTATNAGDAANDAVKLTLGCRKIGEIPAVHCFATAWKSTAPPLHAEVVRQYSLGGQQTAFDPQNGDTATFDRDVFLGRHPEVQSSFSNVEAPRGMTMGQLISNLDAAVKSYTAPWYSGVVGPNSNSAVYDVVQTAGVRSPNLPESQTLLGAWQSHWWQNYYAMGRAAQIAIEGMSGY